MISHSPTTPVFVYGALRSGTTLFRLILEAHPVLSNPGEVDFLFDYLHRDVVAVDGWSYDIAGLREDRIFHNYALTVPEDCDGLALLQHMLNELAVQDTDILSLNVHRHAAKIAAALPSARFIHLLRDPRDVARSSIGAGWTGNSYYGVAHWIRTEQSWDEADIASERVLTVRFETLMAKPEVELSRICAFLGTGYDAQMLEYHHGTNFGPLDPRIAFGWKRKSAPREVALIEGRVGGLLDARGYEANGVPVVPGFVERQGLALGNRWNRWRYNSRRYGVGLFISTHAARVLGLKRLHQRLRQKQEDIRTRIRG